MVTSVLFRRLEETDVPRAPVREDNASRRAVSHSSGHSTEATAGSYRGETKAWRSPLIEGRSVSGKLVLESNTAVAGRNSDGWHPRPQELISIRQAASTADFILIDGRP